MKTYVAAKSCKFADKVYQIGETVPVEVIDPNRVCALLKYGIIQETEIEEPVVAEHVDEPIAEAPKKTQAAGTGSKKPRGKKVE